ncbi:hypothetical protein IV203_012565 [Nitzschia inconspicua]|uniref:Uncharacterized protein n=1 Tax=Nitzschia inconspicua TaxID=303405 RepID=A0A9K3KVR3_9STRA|nr:hypothetical protein IV203_012565 [Nitzschia inconspicua]
MSNEITPSVGIEFDTWEYPVIGQDDRKEMPADHITVWKDGDMYNPVFGPYPAKADESNIEDGTWYYVYVGYDSERLELTVKINSDSQTFPIGNLISNGLGEWVYWGFTSATGDAKNEQKVELPHSLQYGKYFGDVEYSQYDFNRTSWWK